MKTNLVMITSLQPDSNYSRYLCEALSKKTENLIVYSEKDEKNKQVKNCGNVKLVWNKNPLYIFSIFKEILKDKPDKVHLQHEINMYGGPFSAVLFPILVFLIKLTGAQIITTIHALPPKNLINSDFISVFMGDSKSLKPFMVKIVFSYLYYSIGILSHKIIVHTHLLKKWLTEDYKVKDNKITVIFHGVPASHISSGYNSDFFLYFGYLVRRKGLDFVLGGFSKYIKKNPTSKYKLVLAGGIIKGQEFAFEEIKKLIKDLKLEDKIIITGFLDEKQIEHYFSNSYCVVVPAKFTIAASGPLSQAFSYGKCVLASKVGNLVEEVENGKEGILVDNKYWDEAFEKVAYNDDLVKMIEQNVIGKANSRNWDKVADLHLKLYE